MKTKKPWQENPSNADFMGLMKMHKVMWEEEPTEEAFRRNYTWWWGYRDYVTCSNAGTSCLCEEDEQPTDGYAFYLNPDIILCEKCLEPLGKYAKTRKLEEFELKVIKR